MIDFSARVLFKPSLGKIIIVLRHKTMLDLNMKLKEKGFIMPTGSHRL